MIKLSLESLASKKEEVVVQDIHFPPSEHEALRKQTTIITHRVSDDADKFEQGDYVYAEDIDNNYCFEVSSKKIIKKIEDSPYFKDLTAGQVTYLKKFDKIAVLTLKKTKYERPYKLSYIKENYPPKVYEMLKKDEVHAWRARTGIELIHLEPDQAEQNRTHKNWQLMPKYLKDASDAKCAEIFGVTNEEHYKVVKDDKNISDDPAFKSIIAKYKSLFGFDLSYMRLIETKTARYTNGKIVIEPNGIVRKGYAGCHTSEKRIYINSDLTAVMKSYNLKGVTVHDFKKAILGHELAHEIWENHADKEFKTARLHEIKDLKFTTPYLDFVKQNASGMKVQKEAFCEYMSALVCGKIKPDSSTESLKEKKDSPAVAKAKKYLEELSKFKVSNNCQKFAAALELKFRGQDEKVTETSSPVAKVFDVPVGRKSPIANWCLIKNATFTKISENDPIASITKTMKGWGENARAIISVAWKSGRGHVFNLAVLDGEVYLLDATANRIKPIEKSEYLKNKLDAKNSDGLIRTDTGSINSEMKKDTFSADEQEISLDDPEPKYISVLQALGKEGSKGKSFEVYRQGKKIGTVRCDEVAQEYGNDFKVWNYSWR